MSLSDFLDIGSALLVIALIILLMAVKMIFYLEAISSGKTTKILTDFMVS